MDIDGWLWSLGLEQYAAAFRDNAIEVLPRLTAEDLKELGVAALGHRRMPQCVLIPTRTLPSNNCSAGGAGASRGPLRRKGAATRGR